MRNALVVAFLGFCAGLALGLHLGSREAPVRIERPTRDGEERRTEPERGRPDQEPDTRDGTERRASPDRDSSVAPQRRPGEPGDAVPEDEFEAGYGVIEVDFDRRPPAVPIHVVHVLLDGRRTSETEGPDGNQTVMDHILAGTYEVWWIDPESGRRAATRVRVASGRRTRIDAADTEHRSDPALPRHLGVLTVHATWRGEPAQGVSVAVRAGAGDEDMKALRTDRRGVVSFAVRPGDHVLGIARDELRTAVAAGEETVIRWEAKDYGRLLLEEATGLHGRNVWVFLKGSKMIKSFYRIGKRVGLPATPSGEYTIYYQARPGFFSIGKATVTPGRTTVFRYRAPRGVLNVELEVSGAARPAVRGALMIEDGGGFKEVRSFYLKSKSTKTQVRHLAEGRYKVALAWRSRGAWVHASAEVTVGNAPALVRIPVDFR